MLFLIFDWQKIDIFDSDNFLASIYKLYIIIIKWDCLRHPRLRSLFKSSPRSRCQMKVLIRIKSNANGVFPSPNLRVSVLVRAHKCPDNGQILVWSEVILVRVGLIRDRLKRTLVRSKNILSGIRSDQRQFRDHFSIDFLFFLLRYVGSA